VAEEGSGGIGSVSGRVGEVMLGEGEEREAYHWHECPGCGVEWEHGSRRCVSGRELRCEGCEGEEELDVPF